MTIEPQYQTKTINLPKGIKINGLVHKAAVVREQIVGDLVASIKPGISSIEAAVIEMSHRVVMLGNIENPGRILIEKLSPDDFDALLKVTAEMDGSLEEKETKKKSKAG